jgi:hypothetical protein
MIRVQRHGLLEAAAGLVQIPLLGMGQPQIVQRLGGILRRGAIMSCGACSSGFARRSFGVTVQRC